MNDPNDESKAHTQLEFRRLCKRYGEGQWALRDIDLSIRQGEFVVLVGPSGCGKSTLLRCLAGLESPSEGDILLGGRRVNDLAPSDRGIGMVFQDYALYPHMKVRQNLSFGLELKKLPKPEIQARITEIAGMLGLSEYLDRKPNELSGGQRQRVAIGRALVKRPSVLLMDEPLSNLDAQLRSRTRVEIAALHRRIGSTTIYVTHDQEEAMTLADRIVVLEAGRIQQAGSPLEVYHRPANRFVAGFIGAPSMNFLSGLLHRREGGWVFDFAGNRIRIDPAAHPSTEGSYVLGFRPESARMVRLSGQPPGKAVITQLELKCELDWVESHGHEVQAIARSGEQNITWRTSDSSVITDLRKLSRGSEIRLQLDPHRLHWFEANEIGIRIPLKSGQAAA